MLSESLARCVAKISGDGYLYYRYIRYANTCKTLIDEFKEDIRKEFGNIKITEGISNTRVPFAQVHGKKVVNTFLQFLKSYKSDDIRIPNQIKEADEKIIKTYLRAIYDDEGSPNLRLFNKTKEWKRNLTITSNSKLILEEIKEIFTQKGIKTNNILRNRNNDEKDKSFVLGITGKNNFIKFRELVGFNHPDKKRRLDLIIESYGNSFKRNKKGFDIIKEKNEL